MSAAGLERDLAVLECTSAKITLDLAQNEQGTMVLWINRCDLDLESPCMYVSGEKTAGAQAHCDNGRGSRVLI